MTIRYASKHGKNLQNTLDAIARTTPFNAGNLKGLKSPIPGFVGNTGQLPEEWRKEILKDKPRYIVYSYETPIAWLKSYANGRKVFIIPNVRYSPTTSNHQSVVRRAVPEYEESTPSTILDNLA